MKTDCCYCQTRLSGELFPDVFAKVRRGCLVIGKETFDFYSDAADQNIKNALNMTKEMSFSLLITRQQGDIMILFTFDDVESLCKQVYITMKEDDAARLVSSITRASVKNLK